MAGSRTPIFDALDFVKSWISDAIGGIGHLGKLIFDNFPGWPATILLVLAGILIVWILISIGGLLKDLSSLRARELAKFDSAQGQVEDTGGERQVVRVSKDLKSHLPSVVAVSLRIDNHDCSQVMNVQIKGKKSDFGSNKIQISKGLLGDLGYEIGKPYTVVFKKEKQDLNQIFARKVVLFAIITTIAGAALGLLCNEIYYQRGLYDQAHSEQIARR